MNSPTTVRSIYFPFTNQIIIDNDVIEGDGGGVGGVVGFVEMMMMLEVIVCYIYICIYIYKMTL